MEVSLSEAKGRLTELARRAQAGDEVILTRHGLPAVRLVPVETKSSSEESRRRRRKMLDDVITAARKRGSDGGPDAARSADFLYDDDSGLPG